MTHNICLPVNYVLILFCIIIGFMAWYIHFEKMKYSSEDHYDYNDNIINKITKAIDEKLVIERDKKVLYDSFYPPERRQPEPIYSNYLKNNFNIPTRGYPDNYQLIGILLRDNTETAYNLFGRQLYPGSNQYEYYVEGYMHNTQVKIPIQTPGNKEIEDNQIITIPGTNDHNGKFIVKLYNYDLPRYNPNLY